MSNALPKNSHLLAHTKALKAAGISIALVMRVPAPLKSLADQVIRSASSVPAIPPRAAERSRRRREARTAAGAG